MKKKLEAELISIAHRILKIKNKSDIVVLHQETQKLYEKLSVLRFVEENFSGVKPTIGQSEIAEKFDTGFDYDKPVSITEKESETESINTTEKVVEAPTTSHDASDLSENEADKPMAIPEINPGYTAESQDNSVLKDAPEIEDTTEAEPITADEEVAAQESADSDNQKITAAHKPDATDDDNKEAKAEELDQEMPVPEMTDTFVPSFDLSFEPKTDDPAKPVTPQFSFDDLLGKDYADPIFVKPEDLDKPRETTPAELKSSYVMPQKTYTSEKESKTVSLNDRLSKGIIIGINDRIAFMQHLFNNSSEDYNRVLSQLMTFDTFDEAQAFIEEMVKPDYNNWNGKEQYSQRFLEIIEKRFS